MLHGKCKDIIVSKKDTLKPSVMKKVERGQTIKITVMAVIVWQ